MPTPRADETEDAFIARCVPVVLEDGTAENNEQAVAVCYSMWENRDNQGAESTMSKNTDSYRELPNFEQKTIPTFVKAVDEKEGVVEHIVSVFGVRDYQGDRVIPGAFSKTILERSGTIRVLDQHQSDSALRVVGKPRAMREIGRNELPQEVLEKYPSATGGLLAVTQYAMRTDNGRNMFHLVDGGFLPETSIGYDPITAEYIEEQVDGKNVTTRLLKEIRLWEYSNVIWGANPATVTTGTKQDDPSTKQEAIDNLTAFLADATLDQRAALWQAWVERTAKQVLDQAPDQDPPRYVGEEDEKGATGSTSLPIADRGRAWDSTAAQRRVRAWANAEDAPNARYRSAFFWYDSSAADQFGSYKLQFADVIDGALTAIPRGVFAVAAALQGSRGGVDIPEGDAAGVRSRVARYYNRMRSQFDDDSIVPPWEKAIDGPEEEKVGRAISAANARRIQGAIDAAQEALAGLEALLGEAMPTGDEDEQAKDAPRQEAATIGQETEAGPQNAPTSEVTEAEIEDWIKRAKTLSEEQ